MLSAWALELDHSSTTASESVFVLLLEIQLRDIV